MLSIRVARAAASFGALLLVGFLAYAAVGLPRALAVDLPRITDVTSGLNHNCVLGEDGSVWCWGTGDQSQLGNGTTESSYDTPVRVQGLPGPVKQVVAFLFSTCALAENGSVWCWGSNDEGQLGDGTKVNRSLPVQVIGLESGVAQLASEGSNWGMCAIRDDGAGVCWGSAFSGRLGDGTEESRIDTTRVTVVDARLTHIVTTGGTTCAVTEQGKVRCWGQLWGLGEWSTEEGVSNWNEAFQRDLLIGPITPTGLGAGVKSLAAGWGVACVLMESGSVRCWDWGITNEDAPASAWEVGPAPEPVDGLPAGIESIAVSQFSDQPWACALRAGEAWCWGSNESGQLGDGTLIDRLQPVKAQTEGIAALAVESSPTLALTRDGRLLAWGDTDPPTAHDPFFAAPVPAPAPDEDTYREPGPLAPPITTHIPTPADISTDPPVVTTNLLLAAVAMVAFTVAIELLNRSLAAGEGALRRWLAPLAFIDRLRGRVDAAVLGRGGRARLADAVRILAIAVFYGIAFALLDPTWDPLSVTGIALVVMMALAAGLVGLGDDVASWSVARRWGVASELSLRVGGLVAALGSVLATRVLVLVPGVMIGAPEALELEEQGLDRRRQGLLAAAGLGTVLVVGGVAWLGTLAMTLLRVGDDGPADVAMGGAEALLLLVFAVAVQNAFVQLLAFRGTAGRALLRSHRVVWGIMLLGVTFAFWHTLVNPRGDLAEALGSTNVQTFLATVGVVLVVAVIAWLITLSAQRRTTDHLTPPPPQPPMLPPPPPALPPPPPPPPIPAAGVRP